MAWCANTINAFGFGRGGDFCLVLEGVFCHFCCCLDGFGFFLKIWIIYSYLISSEHEGQNMMYLYFGELHQFL